MKTIRLLQITVLLGLLSACATVQRPAFDESTQQLDLSEKSVVLLNVSLDHAVNPKYQPQSMIVYVESPDASKKAERFNFVADRKDFAVAPNGVPRLTFRGQLAPGSYELKAVSATASRVLIIGTFFLPLDMSFDVKPNEILYLGDILAKTRKREKGEFRAGPVIPLLDQSVSGIAGSTYDVEIVDGGDVVLGQFSNRFPVLRNFDITTRILPQFNRGVYDKDSGEEGNDETDE